MYANWIKDDSFTHWNIIQLLKERQNCIDGKEEIHDILSEISNLSIYIIWYSIASCT